MSAVTFESLKRTEARVRMASLRRMRKSRRAALAFESRHALADGSQGRITNLAQVLRAMKQLSRSR